MDHKRGYNLVEQAHEYAARKRLKDLSHSGSLFAAATRCNNNNNNTNNFHDANTTTRAKANKYPEVEKGSQQQAQQQSAHVKHIEDVTYRRLLPVVKKVCLFWTQKNQTPLKLDILFILYM
jgi:heterodisulfide reductase subunit B